MSEICTFEAYNIVDALRLVKETLGADAKIIGTRKVRPFLGLGKEKIQIIAQKKQENLNILNEIQSKILILSKSIEELKEKNQLKNDLIKFLKKDISVDFAYEIASISNDINDIFQYFERNFLEISKLEKNIYYVVGPKNSGKTAFIKSYISNLKSKETKYITTKKLTIPKVKNNEILFVELNSINLSEIYKLIEIIKRENELGLIVCFEAAKYPSSHEWNKLFVDVRYLIKVITKIDEVLSKLVVFETSKKIPGFLLGFTSKKSKKIIFESFQKEKYIDIFISELYGSKNE
ncbi:MAG: hypothetical protein N2446_01755 [Elusimicrobiales bacterium]|nr:hypothetical protein [Elusimicrobiales bacterium]